MQVFVKGGNRETRRKPLEQNGSQQQTRPTYGNGPESNPGNISGRQALLPLREPCFPDLQK